MSGPSEIELGGDVPASIRENFRRNLARILAAKGIKQKDLARAMGVDPAVITFWKKGHRYPETPQLDRLIEVLNLRPEDLFRDPGDKEPDFLEAAKQVVKAAGYDVVKKL